MRTDGIHHVTAITADAQRNIDFYCGVLGLRLVKVTVNFDDPRSYHLYYGDELGRPGTAMTFFVWPGGRVGRVGPPQATATAFAAPRDALGFWTERLRERGGLFTRVERFGEGVIEFADADGLRLEIVGVDAYGGEPWRDGPIAPEHALRGFYGVTLSERDVEGTSRLLTNVMGFRAGGKEGKRFRYHGAARDEFASVVDVVAAPEEARGSMGAGAVHHVAFRTPNDAEQAGWRERIGRAGIGVTEVKDRNYFRSIYFHEPGGVLFEIATEAPGFTVDEPVDRLGTRLCLPEALEARRGEIEAALPRIELPGGEAVPTTSR